jgi:hypothetical protein
VYHQYHDMKILLISYLCRLIEGKPRALGCHRVRWVTQVELQTLPMTEADIPLRNAMCSAHGPPRSPTLHRFLGPEHHRHA